MRREWTADVEVTPALAARSIAEQFPQLAEYAPKPIGEGFDNAAFRVGDYVFRFPRRSVAVPLLENELRVLPAIAPLLTIPIPAPQFIGAPDERYPWPFAGYAILPGVALSHERLEGCALRPIAVQLGEFLRALHAVNSEPLIASGLPPDTIGRLNHAVRMPKLRARFEELCAWGHVGDPSPFLNAMERVAPDGHRGERFVLHGDLYARHLLVENGRLSGVIDWGDLHYGNRAIDLSMGFEIFPPAIRDAFFAAYGAVDDATLELARYRAVYHAALVAHYGAAIGDDDLLQAGLRGLAYCNAGATSSA